MESPSKIVYPILSYEINGLLFKTHQDLDRFRKEKQYGDYLEQLLQTRQIPYVREYRIQTKEKIRDVADFIINGKVLLELKAKDFISREDYDQTQRYLRALNLKLGIIVNFRPSSLVIKRTLNSQYSGPLEDLVR